ncbi:AMP-binding protein [Actinomycetospora endophytica]|uniref:AMP-binding protein n=1 Tax=Actinomycetospora endophytica TaxID=2291215 RepID=A0ABS8PDR0_9PSEU|nr:AMP-binding protein [Actinomycetospora endophytica]MCD2195129.1 AMP-binding protein [Actinomycetospora endophytica]
MTASLRALLEHGVATGPDTVVLEDAADTLTWAALHERACGVAAALVRDGVAPQDRVVFIGRNDVRYFDVLFGCALAGAVLVPLNWRLHARDLLAVVEDCGATVVVVDDAGAQALAPVADALAVVVSLDAHPRWPELAAWRAPARDPEVPARPEDIAVQLYTSGTTGSPKGAMFANGTNVAALLDDISVAWGFTADDVSLLTMPLFHMGGLAWALAGLARGARGIVVRDFVPDQVLRTMRDEQVTLAFCVPTMLAALCAVPGAGDLPLALRQMVYSGAPISPPALATAQATLRCDFVQIYGLTEATGAFAQLPAADHRGDAARSGVIRSAGTPYPWVEVTVRDPESGRDVGVGGTGEILTRSRQNMVGYWNRPEETAAVLTPDGWLRTGDIGYRDGSGRIYLLDRAKDVIISGGENVYPVEVENVLAGHPDLAEVAVIGVPDPHWGETVKAVVVPRPGATPDAAAIIAWCRGHLAGFQCPTSVDLAETLPRTATGKVRKPLLRAPYWQGQDRAIH